jgi:hypothetical protein
VIVDPVALLVIALAVVRLTGLVVEDDITEPIREWVLDRVPEDGKLAYLLTCPWCVSIYLGTAAALLAWWHSSNPAVMLPAMALAFSQVAGMTASIGR